MPIDSSIYGKLQPLDISGNVERGLRMGDLMARRQQEAQEQEKAKLIDQAYQSGITRNSDGSISLDKNKTLGMLAGIQGAGRETLQANDAFRAQESAEREAKRKQHLESMENFSRLFGNVKDQNSYSQALAYAPKLGLDVSDMPQAYDPNLVNHRNSLALTFKEKLEQQNKQTEIGLKKEELGIKRSELQAKKANGENLPVDKKKLVENLATKNANKISIANQIDAVMKGWELLNDDQKLSMGRQLLKTLNSPEGADAIGAEEAKRLGSRLEFALGNFTNSNPTQFGRDLEGFAEQARNTSKFIKKGVQSNEAEIDRSMGRASSPQQLEKPQQVVLKTHEIEWAD